MNYQSFHTKHNFKSNKNAYDDFMARNLSSLGHFYVIVEGWNTFCLHLPNQYTTSRNELRLSPMR